MPLLVIVVAVIGLAVPTLSSGFGLYDHVPHWGKLVHAIDSFCATLLFGFMLFGWRDFERVDLSDELATLLTALWGILFGVLWEIIEFVRDWVAYSDLQKSNSDTMTDFLCNDAGTVFAALLALRLYRGALSAVQRTHLGQTAEWLVDGPSRALDRHGMALALGSAVAIAAMLASLWFSGRPAPGFPIP